MIVGAVALATLVAGCGPSTSALTVELRAAETHAPIVGAAVAADSLAFGPSLAVGDVVDDLMGRRAAFSDRARTDAMGLARLEHIADRAIRVMVIGTDLAQMCVLVDQSPTSTPTAWMPIAGSSLMEFRVAAPGIRAERRVPPGGPG